MFTNLKSVIYPSGNLERDKAFWSSVLGIEPYFEEAYYVGFKIDDCELGLDPNAANEGISYPVAYWHVPDCQAAVEGLVSGGAELIGEIQDVGEGMKMARLRDANGNIFGVIDQVS